MKSFSEIVKLILSFFLNKRSAKYLHWDPKWFGEKEHSRELPAKVAKFQKVYGVKETGIVDEGTVRRRATEKEALKQVLKDVTESKDKQEGFIICDGKKKNIEWGKVVLFDEDDGLRLSSKNFKKFNGVRKPTMFVVHWDVCLSSRSCFNILQNRGLSVHFLIDNDGTIFQIMDCNDIGWHAGNRKVNNTSLGVEISNAYYPKYQALYKKRGFGERPMMEGVKVHGKELEPFTGFYPVQLEALKALTKALNEAYDIPLVTPMENEQPVETIYSDAKNAKFKGVVNHYHLTERKIDCAGLKLEEVLK